MKYAKNVTELIGHTPLIELSNYERNHSLPATILGKLESRNPGGSSKDRIGFYILEQAEKKGLLKPGGTIIESTSGNTGIGLAAVAAAKGYRIIICMPESMSIERRNLLKAYGAELVLTDASLGMAGANEKAAELTRTIDGSFTADQFNNPDNAMAH